MPSDPVSVGDHTVRVLKDGRETFPAMLEAIGDAKSIVRIEMYWWASDSVGRRFLDAVVAAAQRGADVRVIVDGFGSHLLPQGFWHPLILAGGQIETFHPMPRAARLAKLRTVFARDHRKIVVADDRAFVGGLNFTLAWAPRREGGEGWRDTALEIRGEASTRQLIELFESTWSLITQRDRLAPAPTIAWLHEDELAIFSNTPAARRGRRIRQAYLYALRRARSSVDITCAYFSPRPLFLRALARAVQRGVRVRILVPLRSDVEFARQASMPLLRWLRGKGVETYGYGGPILHAKTAVVDGDWCTVGSHNLDGLSLSWNLECNAVLRNREIAAQLTRLFEEDLNRSVVWPPAGSGLLERFIPDAIRRWYSSG